MRHYQFFHGALPDDHKSSRSVFSRLVTAFMVSRFLALIAASSSSTAAIRLLEAEWSTTTFLAGVLTVLVFATTLALAAAAFLGEALAALALATGADNVGSAPPLKT